MIRRAPPEREVKGGAQEEDARSNEQRTIRRHRDQNRAPAKTQESESEWSDAADRGCDRCPDRSALEKAHSAVPYSHDLLRTVPRARRKRSIASSFSPLFEQGMTQESTWASMRLMSTPFKAERTAEACTRRESQSSPAASMRRMAATCPSIRASLLSISDRSAGRRFPDEDSGCPSSGFRGVALSCFGIRAI